MLKIEQNFRKSLRACGDIDFVFVREGTEGLYTQMRGVLERSGVKELINEIIL